MKLKFVHLLGFSAFVLASAAAFYSVYGLSQLFSGAQIAVIIMASSLELAKLVSASFIYRYWTKISKVIRTYFIAGILVLMSITSLGIYGFLTNAYQKSSSELTIIESQVSIIDNKKTYYLDNIKRTDDQINLKDNRVRSLTDLRAQQETRLDSLYKKGLISSAKRTEKLIEQTSNDIVSINKDIEKLNGIIQVQNDSINKFNLQILELRNTTAGDLGPLKYISEVSGIPMNMVVNYLVLLLIFVFDPLAVCLVIATNIVMKEDETIKKSEPIITEQPEVPIQNDNLRTVQDEPITEILREEPNQNIVEDPIPPISAPKDTPIPKARIISHDSYTDERKAS